MMGLSALICLDIIRRNPADSHSVHTLLMQYFHGNFKFLIGKYMQHKWLTETSDVRKYQEKTLLKILKRNASTEYGKHYVFSEVKNREQYVNIHPITEYKHFKGYIDRMVAGEEAVLTNDKVIFIALTSGTTGKYKMYPFTQSFEQTFQTFLLMLWFTAQMAGLRRVLFFRLFPEERLSPTGLRMGGAAIFMLKPVSYNIAPGGFLKIRKDIPAMYIQAVFALADPELGGLEGASSNLLYSFFKQFFEHSDKLCNDIERGDISDDMDIPEDLRLEFKNKLIPDPARAKFLREEFRKGNMEFAKRVWPHLTYVTIALGGSFELCANILRKSFLKGIQLVAAGHGGSEGLYGWPIMNENLDIPIMTFIPSQCFLEFIPLEDAEKPNPKVYFMDQVCKPIYTQNNVKI